MSRSESLSPELQEKISKYQNMQNSLRALKSQIEYTQSQTREVKATLKELEKIDENTEIFRMVGQILFRSAVPTVKSDLEEKSEFADLRLQQLKKEEDRMAKAIEELERDLSALLPSK